MFKIFNYKYLIIFFIISYINIFINYNIIIIINYIITFIINYIKFKKYQ